MITNSCRSSAPTSSEAAAPGESILSPENAPRADARRTSQQTKHVQRNQAQR